MIVMSRHNKKISLKKLYLNIGPGLTSTLSSGGFQVAILFLIMIVEFIFV